MPSYMMSALEVEEASIASGASLSGAVDLGGLRLFGIVMPSSWTAADLTFQVSFDGGLNWSNMYDNAGSEITVVVSAGRFVALEPAVFASVPMMKVRSGTASGSVAQGQDRAIKLVLRSV